MKFFNVIWVILFIKVCTVTVTTSLSMSAPHLAIGICTTLTRVPKTRLIPYLETYRQKILGIFFKLKTRTNYRAEMVPSIETKEVCCENYSGEVPYCKPICDPKCEHAVCITPNTCHCDDGYEKSEINNVCTPICEPVPCVHGVCVSPHVCECNDGYKWHSEANKTCIPQCENDCLNGDCVAPNICRCHENYRSIDNRTCEPVCSEECVNGKCTYPEVCSCDDGYAQELGESPYRCYPVCQKGCLSGNCVAPDTCTCQKGFALVNDQISQRCVPYCEVPCGPNGTCTEPNVCACDQGFQMASMDEMFYKNETAEFACKPICENACIPQDGCIALSNCTWENDTDVAYVTECPRNCSGHGICKYADQPCDCYNGWSGWSCDKPTLCITIIKGNDEIAKRISNLNNTNNTHLEYDYEWPNCNQCTDVVNNETSCFAVPESDTQGKLIIKCLLSTELPCYEANKYDFGKTNIIVWTIVGAITFIIVTSTTAACIMYYHRKKRLSASEALHKEIAAEYLITDKVIYSEL